MILKNHFKLFLIVLFASKSFSLSQHELFWQNNNLWPSLEEWSQDFLAKSRVLMRNHIKERLYKSVLDVPCGPCPEFFGYKNDQSDIEYFGLDITPKYIEFAKKYKINAIEGSIEIIPFSDNHVDVCYSRHILEHLIYYENAINELIRVAKKEVIIIFFIPPTQNPDEITYISASTGYYNNHYNITNLEKFILKNPKVKDFSWQELLDNNLKESILHIYLN